VRSSKIEWQDSIKKQVVLDSIDSLTQVSLAATILQTLKPEAQLRNHRCA